MFHATRRHNQEELCSNVLRREGLKTCLLDIVKLHFSFRLLLNCSEQFIHIMFRIESIDDR
jgi:hypothetical protein